MIINKEEKRLQDLTINEYNNHNRQVTAWNFGWKNEDTISSNNSVATKPSYLLNTAEHI